MKSMNILAAAVVLALSSAGMASAATYYVTGSTAFRVADVSAEVNLIGASNCKATYWGATSLTGASQSVVESSDGTTTVFFNHFTGSIAGDEAIVDGLTVNFGNATGTGETPTGPLVAATNTTPASGGNGRGSSSSPSVTTAQIPDIVFSDVSFSTAKAIINSPNQTVDAHTNLSSFSNSAIVGIIPFVFVANGSTDVYSKLSGLSMDPQKFTYTWQSGGSTLLSFYTGQNTDEATTVYPFGRDIDSGTRAAALAETGYTLAGSGVGAVNNAVAQFAPFDNATDATNDDSSGAVTGLIGGVTGGAPTGTQIGAIGGYPPEGTTIDGYNLPLGDGGYNSGGNLATALSTQFVSGTTNTVVVGYLGVSDAQSALGSGTASNREPAVLLAYDGSKFDPTTTASATLIQEGQYTFWGYESIFYSANGAGVAATNSTSLKSILNGGIDELSSDGVTFNAMNVSRTSDGGNIQ